MSRTFLLALALGAAAAAQAQPPAPAGAAAAEPRAPKLGIIDLGKISSESMLGKGYAAQIESLGGEIKAEETKKQTELQKMETSLKALQDELEKQQAVLSAEAADRKRQEIKKKERERDAFVEDGREELRRMRERAQSQAENLNNEFQAKIKPHIDAVAKERSIDIILNSQAAIAVNKDYDISRDVIAKADEAEKVAKSKAPAAKPATSASPKPGAPAPKTGAPPAPKPSPSPSPQP
jgi:outer membrane protein